MKEQKTPEYKFKLNQLAHILKEDPPPLDQLPRTVDGLLVTQKYHSSKNGKGCLSCNGVCCYGGTECKVVIQRHIDSHIKKDD